MNIRSLSAEQGTMVHLLISVALVNTLLISCTPLCNKTIPSEVVHNIKRRNIDDSLNNYVDSDFPLHENDSIKMYPETERLEPNILPTQVDIDNSQTTYQQKSYINGMELPSIPENEYRLTENSGMYETDKDDSYVDFNMMVLFKDLYDCIELHRLKASRPCTGREENNDGTENLQGVQKLSDEDLDIKIGAKCEKINAIIRSSFEEIKGKYVKNSNIYFHINDDMSDVRYNKTNNYAIESVGAVNTPQLNHLYITEPTTSYIDTNEPHIDITDNYEYADHNEESEYSITATTATLDDLKEIDTTTNLYSFNNIFILYDTTTTPSVIEFEHDKSIDDPNELLNKIAVTDDYNVPTIRNHKLLHEDTTPLYEFSSSTTYLDNVYGLNNLVKIQNEVISSEDLEKHSEIPNSMNNENEHSQSPIYNESPDPVIKIITRELSNGTAISVINGTETLNNNDFPYERNYSHSLVGIKNGDVKNNVTNILYGFSIANYRVSPGESLEPKRGEESPPLTSPLTSRSVVSKSLIGHLYLVHDTQKIPARFIQDADGKLNVGIDILSLCDKESKENNASLIKAICNCINVDLKN